MQGDTTSSSPIARALSRPNWIWVAGILAGAQLLLICGHLIAFEMASSAADPKEARHLFDFNQEDSLPTYWSAVVAALAGVVALRYRRGLAWILAGAALIWVGLEEAVLHLHEDVQIATGIDWPVLYAPALVAGGWVLLTVARDLDPTGRKLLVAGLGCMVAGVGAELLSSPSIAIDFQIRNLFEENFELAGTGLVLCAFASAAWPTPSSDPADARTPARADPGPASA